LSTGREPRMRTRPIMISSKVISLDKIW